MVRIDFKVKCLFTYRDSIINEACKDKKSFMYFEDKKLKSNHAYYYITSYKTLWQLLKHMKLIWRNIQINNKYYYISNIF